MYVFSNSFNSLLFCRKRVQELDKKQKRLLVILGIVGVIILGIGVSIIIVAEMKYYDELKSDALKPIPIISDKFYYFTNSEIQNVDLVLHTNDVFAVNNPFDFTMTVKTTNPEKIDKIVVYGVESDNNAYAVTTDSILNAEKNGSRFPKFTLLKNENNNFTVTVKDLKMFDEIKMAFVLIPYFGDTPHSSVFAFKENPVTIYPSADQFQAQTNRDTQRQNIETAKTNAHVEGLTFVIIGIIPLSMFIQIFIDRVFKK